MSRDWHELNSPEQIQPFMERFGNFHDGCIREFHVGTSHYVTGDLRMHFDAPSEARVLVQRQFHVPSAVELRFAEVVGLRWSPPRPNYDAIIFSATLFVRAGIVYWADDAGWAPEASNRRDCTWVAAGSAWWRDASEWMGPELRYRQRPETTPSPTSSGS